MWNDGLAWLIDSAVHVDDQLVLKAHVSVLEKAVEVIFEGLKQRLWDQILDWSRELIVEVKFLDDQIEIVYESILDKLFDWMIKLVGNLLLAVAIF